MNALHEAAAHLLDELRARGEAIDGPAQVERVSCEVQLGREAEQLARTALEKSTVVPEFWVRLGVALDLQGRWGEAGECFTHALQLAPKSANAWYYYAYHLCLIPATRILAGTAVHTALTLDPGLRPAITLQKSLSLAAEGR